MPLTPNATIRALIDPTALGVRSPASADALTDAVSLENYIRQLIREELRSVSSASTRTTIADDRMAGQ